MSRAWMNLLIAAGTLTALFAVIYLARFGAFEPPPDFSDFPAGEPRKQVFFGYFRPLIRHQNDTIRADRAHLEELASRASGLTWIEQLELAHLAGKYDLDTTDLDRAGTIDQLRLRIDVVPASLVLAQAAKESGWGTARFARDGNNYFGQRCWEPGCGLVPDARSAGATFEVATFLSPLASLESYLRNLNTHDEYEDFRHTRAELRNNGRRLRGTVLAEHLSMYSERRAHYIEELKSFIRFNKLEEDI